MTDLTARIAAHPVAKATRAYDLEDESVRWAQGHDVPEEEWRERLESRDLAEAALTAALDAEDARAGDIEHHLTPLIGWLRLQPITTDADRLAAIDRLTAAIRVLSPSYEVARTIRPAVTHERPDEPAGLTACCGKTEPRIASEGGVLVDDPDAVTCPREED